MFYGPPHRSALAFWLLCAMASAAWAFDGARAAANDGAGTASDGAAAPAQDTVILPELTGLKLIDSIGKLQTTGVNETGITVDGLPMLEEPAIREKLQSFLGKPLTESSLRAILQSIIDWYGDQNYPFVDVAPPAGQDVTNGVVQLVVTEFRAGKVTARGNRWFSSDFLTSQVRLKPGDRINIEKLVEDKNWINQNPFRTVNIVAERNQAAGTTDFVVDTVREQFPGRVFASYDNSGTPILGHDRWSLGFNWGDAFWMDQQLSYQFTSSNDFWHSREKVGGVERDPAFVAHALSYMIPLPWRDKLTIFGSYATAVPRLGPDLGLRGVNGQASLRYQMPLPSTQDFDQQIQFGYDFKTSNNNLQFGGFTVSDVTTEIDQFLVIYNATLRDEWGQTGFENSLVYSPGRLTDGNTDLAFALQAGSPAAKANYLYDHFVFTRLTGLPKDRAWVQDLGWFKDTSLLSRFVGQVSNRNLLPSEQLGLGGSESVRGYDERAANGSEGFLVSQELRSPPFSLATAFGADVGGDQTQLAAFWDYGTVWEPTPVTGAPSSTQLQGVGLGFHYIAGPDANFKIDLNYGWQLRKLPGALNHSQFGHISVTIAY